MTTSRKKLNIFYILLGTTLEHLDSMLFALYLPILAQYFFAEHNVDTRWFLGFLSFSLYFIIRPFGALFLGMVGDTYGRKVALLISITMMSVATLGLGCAPSYQQYGVYSTTLFLLLRILQGFSVAGEYGVAMTYLYETVAAKKHLLCGALLISATHCGGLIASLNAYLSPDKFQYIFIFSGLLGLISMRGRMLLVDEHIPGEKMIPVRYFEISDLRKYLPVFAIGSSLIFIFYTTVIYFNKIMAIKFHADMKLLFKIDAFLLLLWVIFSPIMALLADYYHIHGKKLMRIGSMGTIFLGLPLIIYADYCESLKLFFVAQMVISVFHIIFCMPTPKIICGFFDAKTRCTHVSFAYAIGISITAAAMAFINDYMYFNLGMVGIAILFFVFASFGFLSTYAGDQK